MQGILLFCYFLGYIRGGFSTVNVIKGRHKIKQMPYYIARHCPAISYAARIGAYTACARRPCSSRLQFLPPRRGLGCYLLSGKLARTAPPVIRGLPTGIRGPAMARGHEGAGKPQRAPRVGWPIYATIPERRCDARNACSRFATAG
jgi:hypothetical protein